MVIPGIHRGSPPTDPPRFKAYSHQTSPEKLGIAYEVRQTLGGETFIVADVSSNTVSLLVKDGGAVTGAFDACVFAPGTTHGALMWMRSAGLTGGERRRQTRPSFTQRPPHHPDDLQAATLALWAAMEIASLRLLAPEAPVALAGSQAPGIAAEVSRLITTPVIVCDDWVAARGCARIARDVFVGGGVTSVLGGLGGVDR